jgi:hypothetical protein
LSFAVRWIFLLTGPATATGLVFWQKLECFTQELNYTHGFQSTMQAIADNISIPLRSASVMRITGWKHKDFESKRRKFVGWILEETRKFRTCSQVELLFCIGK